MIMRIGALIAVMILISGCTSLPGSDGKVVNMENYAGSGTVSLRVETAAQLEKFFATLPRAKYPEPEFSQPLWDKPGLPESLRPKATIAQQRPQSAPKTKPMRAKKYTILDESKFVATINVYDSPDDKWPSSGYLILEEGIRVFTERTTKHVVLELDKRSLADLKTILDSALVKPNMEGRMTR